MSILSLPFMSVRFQEHPVNGVQTKFHGITPKALGGLKGIAKPFFKAVSVLFSSAEKDSGAEQTYTKSEAGAVSQVVKSASASAEVLRLRTEQRSMAIEQLIESLLGESTTHLLVMVIFDSLRLPQPSGTEREEFLSAISMDTLVEILHGIAKVNEKTFAPLLERAGVSPTALRKAVESRLRVVPQEESPASTNSSTSSATT